MKFKASFNQAVEGIERVEVVVEADTLEEALELIEQGTYERYLVVGHDFVRTSQLGTIEISEKH